MTLIRRSGLYSGTWMGAGKTDRRVFLLGMLLHFALMLAYNQWQSPACDESSYFSYALRWAKGQPERTGILDDSKTPVLAPALWALLLKPAMPWLAEDNGEGLLQAGRIAMYGYYLLLSFGVFCWAYRLFGSKKWILPWLLFLADPLLNANALLIGSDLPSACCWLWAAYLALRFALTRAMRYWWLLSLVCGLALLVKPSMVFLLPLVAGLLLLPNPSTPKPPATASFSNRIYRYGILGLTCLFFINTGYYFSGTGKPLDTYAAQSNKVKNFQHSYPQLSSLPMPVPQPFFSGYDLLLRNAETGGGHTDAHTFHGVYLNGDYKTKGGFKTYYAWQFFYKITPLLLLCLAGTLYLKTSGRFGSMGLQWPGVFVWIPPLFFVVLLSFTNPFQIGIRHALPAWPFLYLLAGPFVVYAAGKWMKILAVAIALQCLEIAMIWPNLTAYTPVWMQPKSTLYRHIYDSGLFYCNDAKIYRHFLKTHPAYKPAPAAPAAGRFALRLNECNSIAPAGGTLSCWLLQHFEPAGHYKSSILLFDISPEEVARLKSFSGQIQPQTINQ